MQVYDKYVATTRQYLAELAVKEGEGGKPLTVVPSAHFLRKGS